jgi:hypothetical protein
MLLKRIVPALLLVQSHVSAQASGEDKTAAIIAQCCSSTIALIHTTLGAVINQASKSSENTARYIPVSCLTTCIYLADGLVGHHYRFRPNQPCLTTGRTRSHGQSTDKQSKIR